MDPLDPLGVVLGGSWGLLGRSWGLWARLGGVLGLVWASLEQLWDYGVAFGAYMVHSSFLGDPFLVYFGARQIMKSLCFPTRK